MNYFLLFALFIIIFLSYYIIFSKNIFYSIISLLIIVMFMSIFYLLMGSFFLFVINIFVYAGWTMALLIFAIHTDHLKKVKDIRVKETLFSFFITLFVYFLILNVLKKYLFPKKIISFKMEFIFEILLKDYITFLMLITLILSVGIIGTFIIIKRR
ncbi:MAG: NADH-quinone oxidoreductase subunit J [candidate division WOR-3 bacterium]